MCHIQRIAFNWFYSDKFQPELNKEFLQILAFTATTRCKSLSKNYLQTQDLENKDAACEKLPNVNNPSLMYSRHSLCTSPAFSPLNTASKGQRRHGWAPAHHHLGSKDTPNTGVLPPTSKTSWDSTTFTTRLYIPGHCSQRSPASRREQGSDGHRLQTHTEEAKFKHLNISYQVFIFSHCWTQQWLGFKLYLLKWQKRKKQKLGEKYPCLSMYIGGGRGERKPKN